MEGSVVMSKIQTIQPREEVNQIVARNAFQGELALLRKGIEFDQVAAVRGDGIRGEPLLHFYVGEK